MERFFWHRAKCPAQSKTLSKCVSNSVWPEKMATAVFSSSNQKNQLLTMLEQKFEQLGKPVQFLVLVGGVFLFFGIHNLLQETMMSIEGFKFGIMLGYMEVLGWVDIFKHNCMFALQ